MKHSNNQIQKKKNKTLNFLKHTHAQIVDRERELTDDDI